MYRRQQNTESTYLQKTVSCLTSVNHCELLHSMCFRRPASNKSFHYYNPSCIELYSAGYVVELFEMLPTNNSWRPPCILYPRVIFVRTSLTLLIVGCIFQEFRCFLNYFAKVCQLRFIILMCGWTLALVFGTWYQSTNRPIPKSHVLNSGLSGIYSSS